MYKLLTRSRIRVEHASLACFRNYLNNYFAMTKRLTRSRIGVELASSAYLGLGII